MASSEPPDLAFPGGRFVPLAPDDAPVIFDLYARCADYFMLQDGVPAEPADAIALFSDVPPSKRPEDQIVFGGFAGERLSAIVALLRGYPGEEDWYLGLLLLDPAARGSGLGRAMYATLERWVRSQGAGRLLLAVLEENRRACRFWRSVGFEDVRIAPSATYKRKTHVRFELARTFR